MLASDAELGKYCKIQMLKAQDNYDQELNACEDKMTIALIVSHDAIVVRDEKLSAIRKLAADTRWHSAETKRCKDKDSLVLHCTCNAHAMQNDAKRDFAMHMQCKNGENAVKQGVGVFADTKNNTPKNTPYNNPVKYKPRSTPDPVSNKYTLTRDWGRVALYYTERFGEMRGDAIFKLQDHCDAFGVAVVMYAIDVAKSKTPAHPLQFVNAILDKWHKANITTRAEAEKFSNYYGGGNVGRTEDIRELPEI
jgi:DnaD/phage-associated family protein